MLRNRLATTLLLGSCALFVPGCLIVVHDPDGEIDVQHWDDGDWDYPHIGVQLERVGRATASQLNLDRDRASIILSVRDGSPAERAGLRRYDVITHVDGEQDGSISRVRSAIRSRREGDTVRLTVVREGKPSDLEVEVEE